MKARTASAKSKGGNRTQAALELKHRVVLSLNKLADRDTNQMGVDELERIVDCLTPEGIGPFLSCIVDTDSEQKSAVRKECVRIMGLLCRFQGDLLGPHLGKMVSSIVKRLKDTDTVVRDACVEAVGVFASCVVGGGGGVPFDVLVKPLFEALGEQNRYVQAGAALCLAKVVDECGKAHVQILQPILNRAIKLLKNPHFMAKAALVELLRSIAEAGGASSEHILSLCLTSILEALKNSDWTTRKTASSALSSICLSCAAFLSTFKVSCIESLESSRFDKVKPVRDAVMHALQCWKNLPVRERTVTSEISSPNKGTFAGSSFSDVTCVSDCGCKENISKKCAAVSAINTKNQNSSLLITRKPSSSYNQNGECCKPNDCYIEIPLPRAQSSLDPFQEESEGSCVIQALESRRGTATSLHGIEVDSKHSDCSTLNFVNHCFGSKEAVIGSGCISEVDSSANQQLTSDSIDLECHSSSQSSGENKSLFSTTIDFSPRASCTSCLHALKELSFIRNQLSDLENKHSNVLDLLQAFMGKSMGNMSILQSKVHNLEHAIEKMSQNLLERMSYPVIAWSKVGMKNESISSTPRLSTCTPQPSTDFDDPQLSLPSIRHHEIWEDIASSKTQSIIPDNEYNDTRRDPTVSLSGNSLLRTSKKSSYRVSQTSEFSHVRNAQASSVSVCLPRGKKTTSERNNTFKQIMDYLNKEDIQAAYTEALCTGDEHALFELMDKTGPVLEKLSGKLCDKVVCTLAGRILEQKFLGSIIPWLQQVVDLSTIHGLDYLNLSTKARRELLISIQEASLMDICSPDQRLSFAQLAISLRQLWCEENPRFISNPCKITPKTSRLVGN